MTSAARFDCARLSCRGLLVSVCLARQGSREAFRRALNGLDVPRFPTCAGCPQGQALAEKHGGTTGHRRVHLHRQYRQPHKAPGTVAAEPAPAPAQRPARPPRRQGFAALCRQHGLRADTVRRRMRCQGETLEQALSRPALDPHERARAVSLARWAAVPAEVRREQMRVLRERRRAA